MKAGDPIRYTEDRSAPETVSSRDTDLQKTDETATHEKKPASPTAKDAPRERNPEEIRKPNATVFLRDEISRHFEIIPYSLRENIIPLLNQCSTVPDFKVLNDFFNLYLNVSRPEQIQIVHALVRQIVAQGKKVPTELIKNLFTEGDLQETVPWKTAQGLPSRPEELLAHLMARPLVAGTPSPEPDPLLPTAPVFSPWLRQTGPRDAQGSPARFQNGFKPLLNSLPLQEMVSALPPKISTEVKNLLIQIASVPASPKQMEALAKKILSLKDPSASVEKILNASNHPSPRIRLAIVTLLKHLARVKSADEFNRNYLSILKTMILNKERIRDPGSVLVQSEAIKVLLEMGHRQKRSQEEMEALLEELDLIPRIAHLLRKDPSKGLALLLSVWQWLRPQAQKRFAQMTLMIVDKRPVRPVMEKALRVLWKAERILGPNVMIRLIRKGTDVANRSVTWDMYEKEGFSNYME